MSLALASHIDPAVWVRLLRDEPALVATALDLMKPAEGGRRGR